MFTLARGTLRRSRRDPRRRRSFAILASPLLLQSRPASTRHRPACPTPCSGVRPSPLSTHRHVPPVSNPTVAANLHQTFDIEINLAPQITLDLLLAIYPLAKTADFSLGQILDLGIGIHSRRCQYTATRASTNSIDVCKANLNPLVPGQIHARNSCHLNSLLSRPLSPSHKTTEDSSARPPAYPCLCLCRGFLQMTLTTPRRLMILQLLQRILTDGLTFISAAPLP